MAQDCLQSCAASDVDSVLSAHRPEARAVLSSRIDVSSREARSHERCWLPGWAGQHTYTLMLPTRNSLTVRSPTANLTASQIFHCHILDHEDLGMMGQFLIQEGPDAEWAGARRIDPRCYSESSVERGGARPFARIVDPGSCAAAEAYTARLARADADGAALPFGLRGARATAVGMGAVAAGETGWLVSHVT